MKIPMIKSLIILISLLLVSPCFSQTTLSVDNEKPGKLYKKIKKKYVESVVSLSINGYLNSDDFVYLNTFKNLKKLDLTNVCLTNLKEKDFKNVVDGTNKYMPLPSMPNLKELILPSECNVLKYYKYDKKLPSLSLLVMPPSCKVSSFKYAGDWGAYNKLKITNVHIPERIENSYETTDVDLNDDQHSFSKEISLYYDDYKINRLDIHYEVNSYDRIIVDTLFLSNTSQLKEIAATFFDPMFIGIKSSHQFILNRGSKEIKSLENITDIMPGAFINKQIQKITIPASISTIPDFCFYNCKNLTSINFEGPIISIGKYAFSQTNITDVTLPTSLKEFWLNAFTDCNLKTFRILATTPPKMHLFDLDLRNYNEKWFILEIPKGTFNQYHTDNNFGKLLLKENGTSNKYDIIVEKPGTIMSQLPMSIWAAIDTLTITGFLYDTDMAVLQKLIALKYLDLRQTFICESPETIQERQRHEEELNAMAQLLGFAAEKAHEEGNISSMSYLFAKGIAALQEPASEIKSANKNCIIPKYCFVGLNKLETVKLPLQAISIGYAAFKNCVSLKNIELPSFVEEIGQDAFRHCKSLKSIRFPRSISKIGEYAFLGCSLSVVDLSACTFKKGTFYTNIFDDNNLQILKLPYGIRVIDGLLRDCTVYFPNTIEENICNFINCNLHFSSEVPPSTVHSDFSYRGSGNKIFVPKNCTTAYYRAFGNANSYEEKY